MKPIRSSLVHRVLPPEGSPPGPFPAIILLHGRGADEEDLVGLTPFLPEQALVISVRAPFDYEGGGYTWYDVQAFGTPDSRRFRESCDRLQTFLADVRTAYPVDPARMILLGFSMGAVMSFVTALTTPEIVRGVVAHSGYIPEGTHLTYRWQDLARTTFFITHGTMDPVIPIQLARRVRTLFEGSTASWTYREYAVGHEIPDEALREVADWMRPLLGRS